MHNQVELWEYLKEVYGVLLKNHRTKISRRIKIKLAIGVTKEEIQL